MTAHHPPLPHPPGVVRPYRNNTPKLQRRLEAQCEANRGHCWHAAAITQWWCCWCSADHDGMRPPQHCRTCVAALEKAGR